MPALEAIHPGEYLRHDCLDASSLSVTAAALALGVSRQALSNVVNGKAAVSAEMALRLELIGWSSAEQWLRLQAQYDLMQARKRKIHVTGFHDSAQA